MMDELTRGLWVIVALWGLLGLALLGLVAREAYDGLRRWRDRRKVHADVRRLLEERHGQVVDLGPPSVYTRITADPSAFTRELERAQRAAARLHRGGDR